MNGGTGMTGLEIDRVSKRYGDVVALREMTFEVRPGELFGFVGSNGAGKTTTMRIALGVLSADGGEVRYDGRPVTHETRRHIGYMPEERGLYPKMKVAEQLTYLARLHGMPAAAARASADKWTERLGVAGRRDDEVQKLSLGNQQRVQLAAALVHEPRILVLDEPFSGLDPVAVDVMSQVLKEKAAEGVPVVFSSHQLDLVERLCDRVGSSGVDRWSRPARSKSCGRRRRPAAGRRPRSRRRLGRRSGRCEGAGPEGPVTELELGEGADDQAVLKAALATGPVREFAREQPSLTELFRSVVTTEEVPA